MKQNREAYCSVPVSVDQRSGRVIFSNIEKGAADRTSQAMKETKKSISPPLIGGISKMPKIETHVHVEGASAPETYYELATQNSVDLPVENLEEWRRFFAFRDFQHFIEVYMTAVNVLQVSANYSLLIEDFYKRQAEQNIVYTEAYLSASFLVDRFGDDEILDAIAVGIRNGEAKYNCRVRFIPDISRHLPSTQHRVLELVKKGLQKGLFIGLGLGGMEDGFPASLFRDTFRLARNEGLHLVAHAGEASGPESIWGAIEDLNVDRIGHGISCLADDHLVAHLRETAIPLEISPSSNYCTGVVKRGTIHPYPRCMLKDCCARSIRMIRRCFPRI